MANKLDKLIVHIGSHKAGSTSIQDFCHEDTTQLKQAKVYYPTGVFDQYPRQHSYITRLLGSNDSHQIRTILERVVSDARARGAETIFLSGEDLCTLKDNHVLMLGRICDEFFYKKEFVLVLRNRGDFFLSQLKHNLTHGNPITEFS